MVHAVPNCGFARAYIISEDDGLIVVDVGSVGAAEDVASYIKKQPGMSLDMVKYVAATHFHIDHIGGVGHFLAKCPPNTKVLFNHRVRDYLEGKKKPSLIRGGWRFGLIPAAIVSFRYVRKLSHMYFESLAGIPLPGIRNLTKLHFIQRRISYCGPEGIISPYSEDPPENTPPLLKENQELEPQVLIRYPLGFARWEVIETPGHTEDSVSFYNAASRELIAGDLIINMGRNEAGKVNVFCWDKRVELRSFELLYASISTASIYPGHGEVIRDRDDALLRIKTFEP